MKRPIILLFLVTVFSTIRSEDDSSSYPYITGNTFRAFADKVLDYASFDPAEVKAGDVIFVKFERLQDFFTDYHPHINARYILISHNSDKAVPGAFAKYLNDDTLIAWFGKNASLSHCKMHQIPIGLPNKSVRFYVPERVQEVQQSDVDQSIFCYINFNKGTYKKERELVFRAFRKKPFATILSKGKPFMEYLRDLRKSTFVVSPRGSGVDCYRTWEALLMGAYPVITHSFLDPIFEGLPVVIVNRLQDVTKEFLEKKYKELSARTDWQYEKLYAQYWFDLINSYR